jgi:hypothetical protein
MGFAFNNTAVNVFEPRTTEQYKPTGAPMKYSMASDILDELQIPVVATAGMNQGVISAALKTTVASYSSGVSLIRVTGTSGRGIYIQITTGGALKLYVDNVLKATAAVATDFLTWKFLALHFDISANPWKGRVVLDGVELIAEFTDARAADTVAAVLFDSPVSSDRAWYNGQIIVQDAYADASPPRYVTRISPDADVSTVGTWTPTTGTNHASTGVDPFDAATDTTEATPTVGDEVITNYTGDLTAKLGGVPGSVDLVTAHSYSTGLNNTARAEVGDQAGATTTVGATTLIGSDTTYAYASAPTKPSGGVWAATDTPKCKYEVVSV